MIWDGEESLAFVTLQVQPMQQISNGSLLVSVLWPQSATLPTLGLSFPSMAIRTGECHYLGGDTISLPR